MKARDLSKDWISIFFEYLSNRLENRKQSKRVKNPSQYKIQTGSKKRNLTLKKKKKLRWD
jgi:hypothetical protein